MFKIDEHENETTGNFVAVDMKQDVITKPPV